MTVLWESIGGVFTASAPWAPFPGSSIDYRSWLMAMAPALAGAWFGAWAAQKTAKDSKNQDELLKEIRSCNLGVSLAIYTFEIARSLHEIFHPIYVNYLDDLAIQKDAHENGKKVQKPRYELAGSNTLTTPIDSLRKVVFEDITSPTNALRAMLALTHAVEDANSAIQLRNSVLEDFRNKKFPEGFGLHEMYFGLSINGQMYWDYRHSIENIAQASDEILFFAEVLCNELHDQACALRERHRRFSKEPVNIRMLRLGDESEAYQASLREKYKGWFGLTLPTEQRARRWWQRPRP